MLRRHSALVALAVTVLFAPGAASAHAPGLTFTGVGTATVDGVLAPGEWAGARSLAFTANAPGGGPIAGELLVMNDGANLYLGVRLGTSSPTLSISFGFDNDHDGVWPEEGSDGVALGFGVRNGFGDLVLSSRGGCPAGSLCGFHDTDLGGSVDAVGTRSVQGGETHIELAKALDSADDANDFSLRAGDVVGFGFQVGLCTETFQCIFTQPVPFVGGDIVVAAVDPAALLAALADEVVDLGPGSSLSATVARARAALDRGDPDLVERVLRAFVHEVEAQAGKSIDSDTAESLVAQAERIVGLL
jgi:hypothetical protein